jgi:hypothetical protein
MFELHTSGGSFDCLDLSLRRVCKHLEGFIFRRDESLVSLSSAGRTSSQHGHTSCLRVRLKPWFCS